jgi:predicted  nucleic acid-binding Zn-ribbon protein
MLLIGILLGAVFHLQNLYLNCRAGNNHDSTSDELHKALNEELQAAKNELASAKNSATEYMNKLKRSLRSNVAPAATDSIDRRAGFEMVRHALFAAGKKFDRDGKQIIEQRAPP